MNTPCLMYHEFYSDHPQTKYGVCFDAFSKQIKLIKEKGFTTLSLYEDRLPDWRSVLLTFDDGTESNLKAGEMLRDSGLTGVFYVIKNESVGGGQEGFLSESQIKELAGMGHTIGIHGKVHDWWTHREKTLVDEMSECKKWLEDLTGRTVITCSAPGGFINRHVFRLLLDSFSDLVYIRNSAPWYNTVLEKRKVINSIAIQDSTSLDEYDKILSGDPALYLRMGAVYAAKRFVKGVKYKY